MLVEEKSIKKMIEKLKRKGFYVNYRAITRLTGVLKRVQAKIDSLRLNVASGADVEIEREIGMLSEGFVVAYRLWVWKM